MVPELDMEPVSPEINPGDAPGFPVALMMGAFAMALSARQGNVDVHVLEDLRERAEQELPPGDGLRFEIITFATGWEAQRRDRAAVVALGEALQRGVDRLLRAGPVDAARRDIHG